MNIFKVLTLIIGISVLAIACGSGGGGGEGDASNVETVIGLKTDTIRTLNPGDTWEYLGSGTINDGVTSVAISGTANFQILSSTKKSPISGNDCLDIYSTINLSTPSGSLVIDVHVYNHQDGTGSIYTDGESSDTGDIWVTFPVAGYFLSMESPLSIGQTHSTSVTFDDGSSFTFTYSIDAIENVSTGVGTFEAYRIDENATINYSNGDKVVESNKEWYIPGLGTVKFQSDSTYYTNGVFSFSMQITATLSSTSVSY